MYIIQLELDNILSFILKCIQFIDYLFNILKVKNLFTVLHTIINHFFFVTILVAI